MEVSRGHLKSNLGKNRCNATQGRAEMGVDKEPCLTRVKQIR
jgi:hypothetical protein